MEFITLNSSTVMPYLSQMSNGVNKGTLFSGDRFTCCDEFIVAHENGRLIGLASIAPDGEEMNGEPTMVGLWVNAEFRARGIGKQLVEQIISRCGERGFEKVRIDAMSEPVVKIYKSLSPDLKKQVKLDCSTIYPMYRD